MSELEQKEVHDRLARLEHLLAELSERDQKKKSGIIQAAARYFSKVFSRNNLELLLSVTALAISCTVAFYVLAQ